MKHGWIGAALLFLSASLFGQATAGAQTGQSSSQAAPSSAPQPDSLVEQLKSSDVGARAKAARELGKRGDARAARALTGALTDPSEKVRREAVLGLAAIHRLESLEALVTATRDTDPDVRTVAVQSVVGYYTGQVPSPGLTGTVKKELRRAQRLFIKDKTQIDPGTPVDPKAISALEAVMNDTRSIRAAREAARGLGILMAQPAVPELVKSAHASDVELARQSLNALAKIKDRAAGPPLIDLLDSPDKDIRRDAAVTVGILRTRDALPQLQARVENDPDAKDREKALEGLAYLGDPVSVGLFTRQLWNQTNKEIRIFAAEGLARAADPKMLPDLQKAVSAEKDPSVRLAIQFAIAAQGKDDYLSAMINELGSRTRGDAAEAYFIELSRDPKFLPKLYPYVSSPTATVRRRLATVLMFTGDATSLEPLDRLSRDSSSDTATAAMRAKQAIRARSSTPARIGD